MSSTAETTYYTNGKVTVTNARLIVGDETHAISGITAVKLETRRPKRWLPIALIILEFIGISRGESVASLSIIHWAVILLPGLIWLLLQRTHYTVTLASASGESRALKSKIRPFVSEVVEAVNKAIIQRA